MQKCGGGYTQVYDVQFCLTATLKARDGAAVYWWAVHLFPAAVDAFAEV